MNVVVMIMIMVMNIIVMIVIMLFDDDNDHEYDDHHYGSIYGDDDDENDHKHTAELSQSHSPTSWYVSQPFGRILSSPSGLLSPVFPSLHHWVLLALRAWIGKRLGEASSIEE